jgi:rubrerythrin
MTYPELLALAMTREKAAYRLYTNLASIAKSQKGKHIFLLLAQEEAQHKIALEIEYYLVTF